MAVNIRLRRGTASAWTTADPTLLLGEVGIETDTGLTKVGDGSTAWTSLPYMVASPPDASGESILLGRGEGGGAGAIEEITLGDNLSMTGSVLSAAGTPPGAMLDWCNATPPSGWLICNGGTYNRADHPALWAVLDPGAGGIGGVGNGTTTFTVPDFRGRIAFHQATSGNGSTLGGTFGAKDHTHTVDPADTASGAANVAQDQEVDSFPLSGGVFVSKQPHVHFTNIGSTASSTNNPPCLTILKIIKT